MSTLKLDHEDNNRSFDVQAGDKIKIDLPESPTGYRWTIDKPGSVLEFLSTDFSSAEGTGVGGGGRRTFTFTAERKGSDSTSLKHWREWEGESSLDKRFSVRINVK
jgi:inhibitor of cysteine peptidase